MWKIIVACLLISIVRAKPALDEENPDESESVSDEKVNGATTLASEERPNMYLIVSEADADQSDDAEVDSPIQKRSAEEADDLETAAGTNVLRPLFVYRQQLAYRERVKKGALRRPGIRPRF